MILGEAHDAFGFKGLLLAPIMVTGAVAAFLHSEWNALVDQFNGHDRYQITVRRSTADVASAFVGHWYVHDAQLTISSLSAATMSDYLGFGGCGPTVSDQHSCTETSTLRVIPSADGKHLTVTIASITYEEDTGAVIPDPNFPGGWRVGDTFVLSFAAPHLLITTNYPKSFGPGNPYWCGTGLASQYQYRCGA